MITTLGTISQLPGQLELNVPHSTWQERGNAAILEPQLSEEPQQPGTKVSDTTKTKTVSRRTAQSCAGCHAGTKRDEHLSISLSPLEVAALTFRVDQLFLCHQRQGRGMETDTILGKLGSTSSRHATAQQLRTSSNKSLAKRCYYSLPSPGITPEPTVVPGG